MARAAREKSIGIRELRASASKILRRVREKGVTVDIIYRGEVIARIVPAAPVAPDPEALAADAGRRRP